MVGSGWVVVAGEAMSTTEADVMDSHSKDVFRRQERVADWRD